mgnify:CR=1 FL=1
MAKQQITITLTHPLPCRFDGKDLELKADLIPPSLKAMSECVRNLVGRLLENTDLEVASEPRIKLSLDFDHYRGCVIIEIDESEKCGELEIKNFFTFLFDEGQAGIFERATESSEMLPETEHIIREVAEISKAALGGVVLTDEASVFVGGKKICTVLGRVKRPVSKLPVINPVPQVRCGSVSGYCRSERLVYFVEKNAKRRIELKYDPARFHEVISRISSNVFNYVEVVAQEILSGNGKVAVTLMSVREIEKDPSLLF